MSLRYKVEIVVQEWHDGIDGCATMLAAHYNWPVCEVPAYQTAAEMAGLCQVAPEMVIGLRDAVRALESLATQHQGLLRNLGPKRCDCDRCAYARKIAVDLRATLTKVGVLKIDADECELCGQKYCDGSDHSFSDAEAEVA